MHCGSSEMKVAVATRSPFSRLQRTLALRFMVRKRPNNADRHIVTLPAKISENTQPYPQLAIVRLAVAYRISAVF